MIRQKGDHTWDLYLRYHKCPKCQYILESQEDYVYQKNIGTKELTCPRCHYHFIEKVENTIKNPIFGNAPKPEFDWS